MKIFKILSTVLIVFLLSLQVYSQCTNNTLYGVNGASGNTTNLYSIDAATGAATLIGSTGLAHITGLAAHPTTGILYAVRSDLFNSGNTDLLTLNPNTGAATVIGSTGHQIPDISFNSAGVLYGWSECSAAGPCNTVDDLVTINLTTGAGTLVGDCNCGTFNTGLAFNSNNDLYMKTGNELNLMDAANGTIISTVLLSAFPQNLLTFNSADVLYTGSRSGGTFTLQTINMTTGVVTNVGTNAIGNMSAIDFCKVKITSTVPTLSEWGLITFSLILLSVCMIYMLGFQLSIGGFGSTSVGSGIPLDLPIYLKTIVAVLFVTSLCFSIFINYFGYSLTDADVPGILINSPILAYAIHLWIVSNKSES
ncbi:MAG: hypothetical protein HOP11_07535 [Saprospiraceae bacterium]|nr:hypothetical protein [Saprospiraceae bacterium]